MTLTTHARHDKCVTTFVIMTWQLYLTTVQTFTLPWQSNSGVVMVTELTITVVQVTSSTIVVLEFKCFFHFSQRSEKNDCSL